MVRSLFLFLLILSSGVLSTSFSQQTEEKLKKLSENADIIVTGNVSGKISSWDKNKTRIYTEATLHVNEYIKGGSNESSIIVTYPGGEVGGIGEIYTHMPTFENNEDVLVFLKKDNKGYTVFDGEEGKVSIITDEKTGEKKTSSNVRIDLLKTQIKGYLDK